MRCAIWWACLAGCAVGGHVRAADPPRPNILWITCEDISPNLGCYGDPYAVTPNLDRLAAQGVRYTHAFTVIGVCAPSRSCLITGMYPPSIGTHHMRCQGNLPSFIKCFPEYLRQAGYYCTNNVKTDYNFTPPKSAWDESSAKAHWRKRKPGQPFFSVFNFTSCHESQIRLPEAQYQKRTADFTAAERHDPAKAPLPPYHPDAPEVRRDWARYADMITFMDKQAGEVLGQLDQDGLAESTIVFFLSDHGAGMPRSKRWLYDSSLRVPFLVRFPKGREGLAPGKPGTTTDRLVSFVDFAPTVLSLAGVPIPDHVQGKAFLGDKAAAPREYVHGFRDRMDERTDMLRMVRDRRYKYIRNYLPHLPYFHHQYVSYMYEMPTMRVWQRLANEDKLIGPQRVHMYGRKPLEEFYDTQADPHEVRNLMDPDAVGLEKVMENAPTAKRLRDELYRWQGQITDLGLLPEAELRTRFGSQPEYEAVRIRPQSYPLQRIKEVADRAWLQTTLLQPLLRDALKDEDATIRYWAAVGLGAFADKMLVGSRAIEEKAPSIEALRRSLTDVNASVRVAAADGLCRLGQTADALPVLGKNLQDDNEWVRLAAIQVLDRLDEQARPALPLLEKARKDKNQYVVRVAEHAVADLSGR
jgi:N-sulfoglucosamine sulfohydrolase